MLPAGTRGFSARLCSADIQESSRDALSMVILTWYWRVGPCCRQCTYIHNVGGVSCDVRALEVVNHWAVPYLLTFTTDVKQKLGMSERRAVRLKCTVDGIYLNQKKKTQRSIKKIDLLSRLIILGYYKNNGQITFIYTCQSFPLPRTSNRSIKNHYPSRPWRPHILTQSFALVGALGWKLYKKKQSVKNTTTK